MNAQKYTCPCCGYKTLKTQPPGSFELCPICFWEDDSVAFEDPDYEGGANRVSLRQAQRNFAEFGNCDGDANDYVRKPTDEDERDLLWKPLEQPGFGTPNY